MSSLLPRRLLVLVGLLLAALGLVPVLMLLVVLGLALVLMQEVETTLVEVHR
jgi:hypothetical protein